MIPILALLGLHTERGNALLSGSALLTSFPLRETGKFGALDGEKTTRNVDTGIFHRKIALADIVSM